MSTPFLDPKVVKAQRHNANRMTDQKLLREFRQVSRYPEQPPIRVAYLDTLRDEITTRGLDAPAT